MGASPGPNPSGKVVLAPPHLPQLRLQQLQREALLGPGMPDQAQELVLQVETNREWGGALTSLAHLLLEGLDQERCSGGQIAQPRRGCAARGRWPPATLPGRAQHA